MSRILDRTWYNSRFIIILFIAYVDYMFSIVRVVLCLYSCSYSADSYDQGVGGRCCVIMMLRQYLSASAPYVLGHVVDCEGDYYSFVESSIVHSSNIGLLRLSCGVISCSLPDPP
jgi:hypothetical protein